MKYGRVDVSAPEQCPEEGRLPGKTTIPNLQLKKRNVCSLPSRSTSAWYFPFYRNACFLSHVIVEARDLLLYAITITLVYFFTGTNDQTQFSNRLS